MTIKRFNIGIDLAKESIFAFVDELKAKLEPLSKSVTIKIIETVSSQYLYHFELRIMKVARPTTLVIFYFGVKRDSEYITYRNREGGDLSSANIDVIANTAEILQEFRSMINSYNEEKPDQSA